MPMTLQWEVEPPNKSLTARNQLLRWRLLEWISTLQPVQASGSCMVEAALIAQIRQTQVSMHRNTLNQCESSTSAESHSSTTIRLIGRSKSKKTPCLSITVLTPSLNYSISSTELPASTSQRLSLTFKLPLTNIAILWAARPPERTMVTLFLSSKWRPIIQSMSMELIQEELRMSKNGNSLILSLSRRSKATTIATVGRVFNLSLLMEWRYLTRRWLGMELERWRNGWFLLVSTSHTFKVPFAMIISVSLPSLPTREIVHLLNGILVGRTWPLV